MASRRNKKRRTEKLIKQDLRRRGQPPHHHGPPKNNHYVPIWYQKRFIVGNEKKLFRLRTSPGAVFLPNGKRHLTTTLHHLPPSKYFVQQNLYTIDLLGVRNDEIETKLFGDIDNRGSQSVDGIISEKGWCEEHGIEHWHHFMEYIGAQKVRTPKGLDWIRLLLGYRAKNGVFFSINGDLVLGCMEQLLYMHHTIWTESIWEVVSARQSQVKFIFSDHPVTAYNIGCVPGSSRCRYPMDPPISLVGTRTIFPLDSDHCLILTNRQFALAPDKLDPLVERTNARYFDEAIFNFTDVIRRRDLHEEEVAVVNYVIKIMAKECVAAGTKDWLYPENILGSFGWPNADSVLRPPKDEVRDIQSIWFTYRDGSRKALDAYGRRLTDSKELDRLRNDELIVKKLFRKERFGERIAEILNAKDWPGIDEQNMMFLDAAIDIFGLSQEKGFEELRRGLSDKDIRTFYSLIQELWPAGIDTIKTLPEPDETFTILYSGEMTVGSLITSLLSFGLYADRILVVNPFPNPCCIREELNPIRHPDQYQVVTYKLLFILLGVLEPWIRSGVVRLIPDPMMVDFDFRELVLDSVKNRREEHKTSGEDWRWLEMSVLRDMFWRTPNSGIVDMIRKALPDLSDEQRAGLLDHIEKMKEFDISEYLPTIDKTGKQCLMQSVGPNLETILYLSQVTGAIPYTHLNVRKWELNTFAMKSADDAWSIVSDAFSSMKFKFLNFCEGHFVEAIRAKGLLSDFRTSLARLKSIRYSENVPPQGLCQEIMTNWAATEEDWRKIDVELENLLGSERCGESAGASFEAILSVALGTYSLQRVNDHLASKLGDRNVLRDVRMFLHPLFHHLDNGDNHLLRRGRAGSHLKR